MVTLIVSTGTGYGTKGNRLDQPEGRDYEAPSVATLTQGARRPVSVRARYRQGHSCQGSDHAGRRHPCGGTASYRIPVQLADASGGGSGTPPAQSGKADLNIRFANALQGMSATTNATGNLWFGPARTDHGMPNSTAP